MRELAKLPILLKELRLSTIRHIWEELAVQARDEGWDPAQYLSVVCDHELSSRYSSRIKRYFKESQLIAGKTLPNFDFQHTKALNKAQVIALCEQTTWVHRAENILIFGPSGVGKTHLAMAIGHALLEQGIRVFFSSTAKLIQKLQAAQREYMLPQTLAKLDRYPVLILDDLGYVQKAEKETSVLFELISERYENRSLIITCNQPFSEWDKIFTDSAMTVAAIDRVVHHASIIEVNAVSYRKQQSQKRLGAQKKNEQHLEEDLKC